MKQVFYSALLIALCFAQATMAQTALQSDGKAFHLPPANVASRNLSNLVSPTKVNVDLLPVNSNKINLGSSSFSWKSLYIDSAIYLAGTRFITGTISTGSQNTAVGLSALQKNVAGTNCTAVGFQALSSNDTSENTAVGGQALLSNIDGFANTAVGGIALKSNTSGNNNTACGQESLTFNTVGNGNSTIGEGALHYNSTGESNTASGYVALTNNTAGSYNTANGVLALFANTIGSHNVAVGFTALYSNKTNSGQVAVGDSALFTSSGASANTAIGTSALMKVTLGSDNTVVGRSAGSAITSQSNNTIVGALIGKSKACINGTLIGYGTDPDSDGYSNITALGYQASNTASNQVRIGNSGVTSIGGFVDWSNISDERVKKNIRENVPGLSFINKLKPVTYNLDVDAIEKSLHPGQTDAASAQPDHAAVNEKGQVIYSGFVAQDVESAAKEVGYNFSGVDAPKNTADWYGLRYSDFVVPLVKAVQELSQENDELKSELADMKQQIADLSSSISGKGAGTATGMTSTLQQNTPNPFSSTTEIQFGLPASFSSAEIRVSDESGNILRTITLSQGANSVSLSADELPAGTYRYSLIVNGQVLDTKEMVITK